jgi:hypothetical protein
MNNLWIACLAIFYAAALFGQEEIKTYTQKYPDETGVIIQNKEHVKLTVNGAGEVEVEADIFEQRIFLDEKSKFYMDESIGYSFFTDVEDIKAAVYIPDGEKYKKVKVKKITEEDDYDQGIFHDDSKSKTFRYEGLIEGGKTELGYTQTIKDPHFFGSFYFDSYFPIENSEFVIEAPADMQIEFTLFGDRKEKVQFSERTAGNMKHYTWSCADMPKITMSSNSVGFQYFATHLVVRIGSYTYRGKQKNLLRNADDLYAYYRNFVREVNDTINPTLDALADSLTRDLTKREEKVKSIFYWVQDQIKYIAMEDGLGGFVPRPASLVCGRRYGDCKDMASTLYYLLNSAGIDAHYTWIGSNDIPYTYTDVPTPKTDNHMICSYHNGTEYVFLDATGKDQPFGMPTAFIQGKEALIGIDEENYVIQKVPIMTKEINRSSDITYVEIIDGTVKGTASITYNGYSASGLRDYLVNVDEPIRREFYTNRFKKGNNKCSADVDSVYHLNDKEQPLTFDYHFEIPDYARVNEDELYFNPFLKKLFTSAEIDTELALTPIECRYNMIYDFEVRLKTPEGYAVDFIPENNTYTKDAFGFEMTINQLADEIVIKYAITENHLILYPNQFEEWNKMIEAMNDSYSELIVFKKK